MTYKLTEQEWLKVCHELKWAEVNVLYHLRMMDESEAIRARVCDIAMNLKINKTTVSRAIKRLIELDYLSKKFARKQSTNPEEQVRDGLQSELGGQSEVITAVGRIDLLTDDQIIEVKGFSDWKGALGQILAYSAFFPAHQKRIHLFGNKTQLKKMPDIELACLSFGILVTGEVVL